MLLSPGFKPDETLLSLDINPADPAETVGLFVLMPDASEL
jgi:hypothetical protein